MVQIKKKCPFLKLFTHAANFGGIVDDKIMMKMKKKIK